MTAPSVLVMGGSVSAGGGVGNDPTRAWHTLLGDVKPNVQAKGAIDPSYFLHCTERFVQYEYDAVLFDLDGVLTPTAMVHSAAWKRTFDSYLEERSARTGEPWTPFDREAVRGAIEAEVGRVAAVGARPVLVGGDHSLTLPALRAVVAARGPVAVVHVDAHSDTSGPETWGDAFHHGTPFRHALTEGLVDPGHLYQIGLRAPWSTPEDGAFAEAHGARIFDMDSVMDNGIRSVMRSVREAIGDRPTYISFDVDACDPSFAPGTGTPVPGGLSSREALALLRGLAGVDVVGVDVVEVSPPLDHADMTANLAAFLAYEGLALMAVAKKRRSGGSPR